MKFDKLVKKYYTEAVYIPRTAGILKKDGKSLSTKKGTDIPVEKSEEADEQIKILTREFQADPSNYEKLNELVNLISSKQGEGILRNTSSKLEHVMGLLGVAANAGFNYKDIIKKEIGGNGKDLTVDMWTSKGLPKGYYDSLKNILTLFFNAPVVERDVRGRSTEKQEVFYFAPNGEPYRTILHLETDGTASKGGFWNTNRFMGQVAPPPVFTNENGERQSAYNPKQFRGANINDIRNAVNHEEAKVAFEAKYPVEKYPKLYRF
jgi:hypothetical protein